MELPAGRGCLGAAFVCLTALSVACGGSAKKEATTVAGIGESDTLEVPRVDPSLCDTSDKRVATFDLNRDDQPDVWKMYATVEEGGTTLEVMTCKQADLDYDGKKDYVATYTRTGEILAEEFDFTFDSEFDAREHYDPETGRVHLIERDSDHDKQPDVWEKYDADGRLESVRRDRNADGKPDYWEQYEAGVLVAILYDDDYDNRVDRKDQAGDAAASGSDAEAEPATTDDGPVDEEAPADEAPADEAPADEPATAGDDS